VHPAVATTAITRVLQNDYKVDPARITAGGRSQYVPLATNDTPEGRSTNRRIRIVILPKLDQFYGMIEAGLNGGGAAGTDAHRQAALAASGRRPAGHHHQLRAAAMGRRAQPSRGSSAGRTVRS
jgi:hypothetical protein